MSISTAEANKVMKKCHVGTRNYDEANNLHAECYGTIGSLVAELDDLTLQVLNLSRLATGYEMQRDALKARIDGGIRVEAIDAEGSFVAFSKGARKLNFNATLILDEGIDLS